MADQTKREIEEQEVRKRLLHQMEESGEIKITPCDSFQVGVFNNPNIFEPLELSEKQKAEVKALVLAMMAVDAGVHAYKVMFPNGITHTLAALKQSNFSSLLMQNGQITGAAPFCAMTAQVALTGTLTAISILSGMFFLTQINKKLDIIDKKLDQILEFLRNDKYTELIAEMSFVKYAYENYASIMAHEQQRTATITSLQEAKKVAMKDIEFYIRDLESAVVITDSTYSGWKKNIAKGSTEDPLVIQEKFTYSEQLYVMSSILESYFAQNHDQKYIEAIEADIDTYIGKYDIRAFGSFRILEDKIPRWKGWSKAETALIKADGFEDTVTELVKSLNNVNPIRDNAHKSLAALTKEDEYYLCKDGSVFMSKK